MKIKLDENLPVSLASRIAALGFNVDTVLDERLGGRSDADVWNATQAAGRFLITQDLDFSDARRFSPGAHHGLLVLRLPDSEQWRVADFVVGCLASADARSWARCFVVATPKKIRVLRPPGP